MADLDPVAPPRRLSSFVGRRAEIAEVRRLLDTARLVTLVGAAGCGKTRLAIAVAAEVGPTFPAGVAFVELAQIQDPQEVPGAVAAALGIPGPAAGRVADLVGDARVLLLIDNAEHLVDAVSALVERLLAACPRLVVVTTSREALRVDGERRWRVPPMATPPEAADGDPAALQGYDAVRLFCARGAEQRADFGLAGAGAAPVAAICRRLDGIPLALELAAARVPAFALTEILRRLDDALGLLTRGRRGAADRQRTLRATIEWSHRLLDDAERRLFRRLALFAGTFDLEAVEAICPCGDLPSEQVADVLQRLVDKSLVEVRGHGGGLRYSLLETIRQYARERLDEAGEPEPRARHARWYAALAARLDDERRTLAERLERMGVEYGNVRLALDWAAVEDPSLEAALIVHVHWFWVVRGSFGEAYQAARGALASKGLPAAYHAVLHRETATWSMHLGDLEGALVHVGEAALLVRGLDDPVLEASVLSVRGTIRTYRGDRAGAERDLERAAEMLEPAGGGELLAATLNNLVMLRLMAGTPERALELAERLVAPMAALSERSIYVPHWLHTLGLVLLAVGRLEDARGRFMEALEQAVVYGNGPTVGALLQALACIAASAGDAALCLELLAAGRRQRELQGIGTYDEPGTPTVAAERASEAALSRAAAVRARERGAGMDAQAALRRARAVRSARSPAPLTPRKRQVVRLVAEGLTNREIALRLRISERTVDAHLEQVRTQLGLSNRVQLATWAGAHLEPRIPRI